MLKKIISIRNIGRFRNSAAPGNPELSRYTLIVGANGFGKTTLCSVLRSLKTGDPTHITGRRTLGVEELPTVELLFPGGQKRFDGAAWSAPYPSLAIFDGTFVAENVHSGEVVEIDHRRNLYRIIIGEEGVRLAEEDARLARQSREKTREITAAARAIQPHIPAGMGLNAFHALPVDREIDARIANQEHTVEAVRQARQISNRPALSEIGGSESARRTYHLACPQHRRHCARRRNPALPSTLRRTAWRRMAATGLPRGWSMVTVNPAPSAARISGAFL